jgi:hypothetical protein
LANHDDDASKRSLQSFTMDSGYQGVYEVVDGLSLMETIMVEDVES